MHRPTLQKRKLQPHDNLPAIFAASPGDVSAAGALSEIGRGEIHQEPTWTLDL